MARIAGIAGVVRRRVLYVLHTKLRLDVSDPQENAGCLRPDHVGINDAEAVIEPNARCKSSHVSRACRRPSASRNLVRRFLERDFDGRWRSGTRYRDRSVM